MWIYSTFHISQKSIDIKWNSVCEYELNSRKYLTASPPCFILSEKGLIDKYITRLLLNSFRISSSCNGFEISWSLLLGEVFAVCLLYLEHFLRLLVQLIFLYIFGESAPGRYFVVYRYLLVGSFAAFCYFGVDVKRNLPGTLALACWPFFDEEISSSHV